MKKYLSVLKTVPLFAGIEEDDIGAMLSCLGAYKKAYAKNDIIILSGSETREMGIVLSGLVHIIIEDMSGSRSIHTPLGKGSLFAEAFACSNERISPVTVHAAVDCEILFIDCRRVIVTCASSCQFHYRLIRNMLTILADKTILLNRKIEHISKRSTREKLLSYLKEQSVMAKSEEFTIPFNRQELADYLCVDRSAMSTELGKLRDEGVISFDKNRFTLIHRA